MSLIPAVTPAGENRVKNPSMEHGGYGVESGVSGSVTTSFRGLSTLQSWVGGSSYQVEIATASTTGNVVVAWGTVAADTALATRGSRFSFAIRYNPTHAALSCRAVIEFRGTGYALISSVDGPPIVYGAIGWQTIEWTNIDIPAGTSHARIRILVECQSTAAAGASIWLDGLHFAPEDEGVQHYIDGSLGPGYKWTGVAGESTSTRSALPTQGPTGSGGSVQYRTYYYASDINNALGADISDQIVSGTITKDIDRAIQSTITLKAVSAILVRAWSWIAVYLETKQENGTITRRQRGLFEMSQPAILGDEASATVDVSGNDVVTRIESYRFAATYNITTGINVRTALIALLALAGITRHSIPETSRVTGINRSYKAGDKLTDALSSLTKAMGWYSIYGSDDGVATTSDYRALDTTTASRTYTLGQRSQLVGPIATSRDDSSFANVVIAVRDNPTLGLLKSTARNDDPRSPGSTTYPGGPGVRAKTITVNEDIDQATLDRTAQQGLASSCILASGTLQTMPDLTIDVRDVIQITVDPVRFPHLEQANGAWYVQQIVQGLLASTAATTVKIRRSEVL